MSVGAKHDVGTEEKTDAMRNIQENQQHGNRGAENVSRNAVEDRCVKIQSISCNVTKKIMITIEKKDRENAPHSSPRRF